jgi:hypothetical protein
MAFVRTHVTWAADPHPKRSSGAPRVRKLPTESGRAVISDLLSETNDNPAILVKDT